MKSKKKTKVPAYAFGTQFKEIGNNMLGNAPDILNTLTTPFLKSNATTGRQAAAQSVSDIASGAATGFQVAGPIGAAVGAGIGLIGRSGEEAEMTSFTDYDEGSLGSGLIGAFGNRRLRRKRAAIKKNAYSNRAAVQGTNYLQSEAYEDMIGMNTDTMANGGTSSSLAYVDDGELILTPDGSISKVPENNKPTDSNLVSLPEGSRVLSDKLKVPGRKETFAQLGEKMMAKKKSKYNDRFAENAAKLNEMNNNMIHDLLFAMQESVKQSKGIKPKTKLIQAAALGDEIKPGLGDRIVDAIYNPNRKWGAGVQWGTGNNQWYHVPVNPSNTQPTSTTATVSTSTPTRRRKATSTSTNTGLIDEGKPELPFTWYGTVNPLKPKHPELLTATNDEMAGLGDALTSQADKVTTLPKSNAYSKPKPENNKFDWGSALSGMASLAPIMSNLFTGRPETVDAVYNPYATSISNMMRRRRYDINPAIEDLNRNRATSNYNASQINTNTGANLAYRLQSAVNTDRAIASLRSQESNANNQYLGDYANTMNSLGQQWVNATNMANEANAQNRATARNIRRAGLSQLSQWAQNRELMRNQEARDMEMWPLYQRFLQAGFTEDDLKALMNSNRNTIKRKGGK
ncbi:hypothetical protein KNV47_gp59 [uncultured phage cr53_1]|uniref:Uncharacterized protein n=1 Tax=uncultured phage cr53_1 TaxID=2772080 RepID=A0A7M1RQY5_9CAUD|nr:hypothetical protein KNV47_gp59 [uncultured phage cr53_1]QOR56763.1 hypothetical protein [uncultured phage cr53_1]